MIGEWTMFNQLSGQKFLPIFFERVWFPLSQIFPTLAPALFAPIGHNRDDKAT